MAKRVILAVAGAGKTYHICNQLDKERRNLVLAYTNENVDNIRRELVKLYKDIPKNTVVMTFHS
jgi:DNA helicase-2/ATP-dependent DNA helicase PcrA